MKDFSFLLLQPPSQNTAESVRQNISCSHCPNLANSKLVAKSNAPDLRAVLSTTKHPRHSEASAQAQQKTSIKKDDLRVFSYIQASLKQKEIPKQACELILKSWRKSTKNQYNSYMYIIKWFSFCGKSVSPFLPGINNVLKFLSELHSTGLQYS